MKLANSNGHKEGKKRYEIWSERKKREEEIAKERNKVDNQKNGEAEKQTNRKTEKQRNREQRKSIKIGES